MSNAMLALGQATLAAQPFSVLMGAELVAFAEGQVELALRRRATVARI
jgi:hypothetical protein